MGITLDVTELGSGIGGDETMLLGALTGLVRTGRPDDDAAVLVSPQTRLPSEISGYGGFTVRKVRRWPGPVHYLATLPWECRRDPSHCDVLFTSTHGPTWGRVPVALVVADLSFEHHPEYYPTGTRLRLQNVVPRQARAAAMVLTVSEASRVDILETYGLDPERVAHVPNTVLPPPVLSDAQVDAASRWMREVGIDGPYLLYLGNLHPRKNLARTIRAFSAARRTSPALADHRLVIAGARWWGGGDESLALAEAPEGSVVSVGRVDDLQREMLICGATALVYVSIFEGFGLPPLEAMSRGTAVIASTRTSIPEVVGSGGLLVDPYDTDAIRDAIVEVITDDSLRGRLVAQGRLEAARYTPVATGTALRAALARAVELGRP